MVSPIANWGGCEPPLVAVWETDAGAVGVTIRGGHDRRRGHYEIGWRLHGWAILLSLLLWSLPEVQVVVGEERWSWLGR